METQLVLRYTDGTRVEISGAMDVVEERIVADGEVSMWMRKIYCISFSSCTFSGIGWEKFNKFMDSRGFLYWAGPGMHFIFEI